MAFKLKRSRLKRKKKRLTKEELRKKKAALIKKALKKVKYIFFITLIYIQKSLV